MRANIVTVYDMQDYIALPMPPRSRLYCLEPIGLGTPYVESLTSYIKRLAYAHCVRPRKLIAQEAQRLLGVSSTVKIETVFKSARDVGVLNGMTPLVKEWVEVLEQLTLRGDLRFLTMLSWGNIANPKGVVRRTQAWCPTCYYEWLQTGQVIYEPLLWSLRVVTQCPIHHQRLLDRCPQQECNCTIPLLTDLPKPGFCPSCGHSLAIYLAKGTLRETSEDSVNETIHCWIGDAVGALLSVAPKLPFVPLRDQVAAGITAYISHATSGSDEVLAHKLGMSKNILMSWQRGVHLPRFDILLTMCFHMKISPLHFLTGDVESFFLAQPALEVDSFFKASQKSEPVNLEELGKALTELLRGSSDSILSLSAVAKKLGYPVSTLRHYFPEQCQTLSRRYQQQRNVDYKQHLEAFLLGNEQLTLNEIARRLKCPAGTLRYRYPELCYAIATKKRKILDINAIHEALQEALQCETASFSTVTEISRQFRCSLSVLYHHFPVLCSELTKKHKDIVLRPKISEAPSGDSCTREAGISTDRSKRLGKKLGVEKIDKIRKELEKILESGIDRPMTMTELTELLGCSSKTLRINFPDLCDKLMKKQEKEIHINKLRRVLERALKCDASSMPSINEIARRLGCSNSTLYNRFPELCKSLVERRRQADDIDGMRKVLETALANGDEPPPALQALSEHLGCNETRLRRYFPELCSAIVERRRLLVGLSRFREQLEEILVSNDPISVYEAARKLNCSRVSLRGHFPELCKSISARHLAYCKNRRLGTEEKICNEVREIVFDLYAQGVYPAQGKVGALVSKPGYFRRLKVIETWKNALRELGLSD